jgi:hypothetical protein
MRWVEGSLLDFHEIIDGVLVEDELANLSGSNCFWGQTWVRSNTLIFYFS